MKRVMMACDRCGEIIPHNAEVEMHCLHNGTNEDSRLDFCQKCFREFLVNFIGVRISQPTMEEVAQMNTEEPKEEETTDDYDEENHRLDLLRYQMMKKAKEQKE